MAKGKSKKKKKSYKLTAATADKHILYQNSVQDPDSDIKFIDRVFKKERGRKPRSLREDFCGTALMCAAWVKGKRGAKRRATGIDLDRPTLEWGITHNLDPIGEDAERITLLRQNVLDPVESKVDVSAAFNFSYCIFKTRDAMREYCVAARKGLKPNGAFFLDIHGGSENTIEIEEETEHKNFTYVWDQQPYDAINGESVRYIHFRFPDGTAIERAFKYDWRFWTIRELREILCEAGFRRVDIYWEGSDDEGEGNGIFRKVKKADQEESWIAYVVAWR